MTIVNQPDETGQANTADLGTVRDRVALVTGGTRGIGAAISGQLAGAGADVAAGYWRGRESAEKFHASMTADHPGRKITVHEGNIGHPDDCLPRAA
jgi:NAD(P)-dependent dehydrogenase (short-subunit alcohol dehydrogenase family)